jgi:hypothetical protein
MAAIQHSLQAHSYRLTLTGNAVHRLPERTHGVQILSGCGWIAVAGKDLIAGAGETLLLPPAHDLAIVSPARRSAGVEIKVFVG